MLGIHRKHFDPSATKIIKDTTVTTQLVSVTEKDTNIYPEYTQWGELTSKTIV